jgi:hypothetical protein
MHSQRNPENTILIACSMMEDEINRVLQKYHLQYPVVWMERGYHSRPEKLRAVLQEQITLAEQRLHSTAGAQNGKPETGNPPFPKCYGGNENPETKDHPARAAHIAENPAGSPAVLLAYGLCGNGTEGLRAESAVLAMPRFDDCINTLLCCGPRTSRALEQAGVYYLTRGWTLDTGAMLQSHQKMLEKYGEKKTKIIMQMMYDGYKSVAVIDDGCYDTAPVQQYAQKCADLLHVDTETVPGGTNILEKLLIGNWDDDILVKAAGKPVKQEDFFYEKN